MVNVFSINLDDLEFGYRLVPSYYFYSKILKQRNHKKGIKYVKFETIAKKISDGEHSHIPRSSEPGVRYLYGRNIKEGIINFDDISDDSFISGKNYAAFTRCHIKQNDILISIYGTVGKSALYKEEYVGKAGIPRHISSITLNSNSPVTGEFLTAFFRSKIGKWQLLNITTGNIQQLLSLKNMRKLDIPIPDKSLVDQITISEDKAISLEIEALQLISQAKSYFYDAIDIDFNEISKEKTFAVGIDDIRRSDMWTPAKFAPIFVNTEKIISSKWPIELLSDIATIKRGDEVGSDSYITYLEKKNGDVPFIRTSDIVNFEIDQFSDYYIPSEIYAELNQDIAPSDVLFTKDGKIGVTGLLTEDDKAIIASGLVRLRLKPHWKKVLSQEYLFLLLSLTETGYYPSHRRSVTASTIPHLREERLGEINIPIINPDAIEKITALIKAAFLKKDKRKQMIKQISADIDKYFNING